MNRFGTTLLQLAWLPLAATVAAHAAPNSAPGYYVGLHVGGNTLEQWPAQVDFGGVKLDGKLGLRHGAHAGLALGRDSEHARYELEYQRGQIKIDSLALGPLTQAVDARGHYETLMANIYRKHRISDKVGVFGGLGAGWGRTALPQTGFNNGCNCFGAGSDSAWVYQGRLGLDFFLKENQSAFFQFTRLRVPGAHANGVPSADYARRWLSAVSVGYRLDFK